MPLIDPDYIQTLIDQFRSRQDPFLQEGSPIQQPYRYPSLDIERFSRRHDFETPDSLGYMHRDVPPAEREYQRSRETRLNNLEKLINGTSLFTRDPQVTEKPLASSPVSIYDKNSDAWHNLHDLCRGILNHKLSSQSIQWIKDNRDSEYLKDTHKLKLVAAFLPATIACGYYKSGLELIETLPFTADERVFLLTEGLVECATNMGIDPATVYSRNKPLSIIQAHPTADKLRAVLNVPESELEKIVTGAVTRSISIWIERIREDRLQSEKAVSSPDYFSAYKNLFDKVSSVRSGEIFGLTRIMGGIPNHVVPILIDLIRKDDGATLSKIIEVCQCDLTADDTADLKRELEESIFAAIARGKLSVEVIGTLATNLKGLNLRESDFDKLPYLIHSIGLANNGASELLSRFGAVFGYESIPKGSFIKDLTHCYYKLAHKHTDKFRELASDIRDIIDSAEGKVATRAHLLSQLEQFQHEPILSRFPELGEISPTIEEISSNKMLRNLSRLGIIGTLSEITAAANREMFLSVYIAQLLPNCDLKIDLEDLGFARSRGVPLVCAELVKQRDRNLDRLDQPFIVKTLCWISRSNLLPGLREEVSQICDGNLADVAVKEYTSVTQTSTDDCKAILAEFPEISAVPGFLQKLRDQVVSYISTGSDPTDLTRFMPAVLLEPISEGEVASDPIVKLAIRAADAKTLGDIVTFSKTERKAVKVLRNRSDIELTLDEVTLCKEREIALHVAMLIKGSGIALENLREGNFSSFAKHLSETDQSDEDITALLTGCLTFGHDYFVKFLYRPKTESYTASLHALAPSISNLVKLFRFSQLSEKEFFHQILDQVRRDNGAYENGDSHAALAAALGEITLDTGSVTERSAAFADIPTIGALAKDFSEDSSKVYESWRSLQQYSKLCYLLKHQDLLKVIRNLKDSGKDRLAEYIETLGFHPTSRVSPYQLTEFSSNPARFLGDRNLPGDLAIAPIRYTKLPYSDLSPEKLRDSLADGRLDRTQIFPPLKLELDIPKRLSNFKSLSELLRFALGTRSEKILGRAQDPKKLFFKLKHLLAPAEITVNELVTGKEIGGDLYAKVIDEVFNDQYGIRTEKLKVIAAVHPKSSPYSVLAGNDTQCCMPWGSTTSTGYTFDPNCAIFTVQIARGEGGERTICQSVLHLDRDLSDGEDDIHLKMPAQITDGILTFLRGLGPLHTRPRMIVCDNAEANPNYKTPEWTQIIWQAYGTFFSEYLRRYSTPLGVDEGRVVIGKGYSLEFPEAPTIMNRALPTTILPYSDNRREKSFLLSRDAVKPLSYTVHSATELATQAPPISGISAVTTNDIIEIALLEDQVYAELPYREGLTTIQTTVIGGVISAKIDGKPVISLTHREADGRLTGYLLANYGVTNLGGQETPCIYVSDLAASKSSPRAGLKLMQRLAAELKSSFIEQGDDVTILADMRKSTTLKFFLNNREKMERIFGVPVDVEIVKNGDEIDDRSLVRLRALGKR